MIKMYCIFAMESIKKMNGSRGKLASMAGHAYLHSYWDSQNRESELMKNSNSYKESKHAYKITLVVDTVEELKLIEQEYKNICGVSLVTDAGLTVFNEPTIVCLGVGPLSDSFVTDTIRNLKVLT